MVGGIVVPLFFTLGVFAIPTVAMRDDVHDHMQKVKEQFDAGAPAKISIDATRTFAAARMCMQALPILSPPTTHISPR